MPSFLTGAVEKIHIQQQPVSDLLCSCFVHTVSLTRGGKKKTKQNMSFEVVLFCFLTLRNNTLHYKAKEIFEAISSHYHSAFISQSIK